MTDLTLTVVRPSAPAHDPLRANLRADLFRYFVYAPSLSLAGKLVACLTVEGIWALSVYRIGRALRTRRRWFVVGPVAWATFRAMEVAVRLATGIHLDVDALIGPGFYVGHHGSIFVGPGARIGRNSSIGQMCLVAASAAGGGAPVLGERVYLGPGCKVLGNVTVGDGAAVGANSVVMADVPRDGVVMGVPARLVGRGGSGAYIYLGGPGRPPSEPEQAPAEGAAEGR